MAKINKQDDKLVITLTATEKLEALREGFDVPLKAVQRVESVDDPVHEIHGLKPSGLKLFGAYIPGKVAVGTFLSGLHKKPIFAVLHHDDKTGIRITLNDEKFSELIIGCDDPGAIIQMLG
ncbi:MAG TPA: hypothetical protein VLH38_03175 [Patescibacteria group bacterium]|nr:hypothetical protein [Patescibacteria group bacterium]